MNASGTEKDLQMDLFGNAVPLEALGTRCTRDETCRAEADEHEPDCPKERELKETYGF